MIEIYRMKFYINNMEATPHASYPFSVCLMNPPYSTTQQYLDMQFVSKVNQMTNMQVVVHPAKKWVSNTPMGKTNAESKHLTDVDIFDANKVFSTNAEFHYGGIFTYDNIHEHDVVHVSYDNNVTDIKYNDYKARNDYYKSLDFSQDFKDIIARKEPLYDSLIKRYRTMVNDGHGFVYEESDLKRGKSKYGIVKNDSYGLTHNRREQYRKWLRDGVYKYCLYKGSYNNSYDEVQEWLGEDPDKLFHGQILWLTNSRTVRDNIRYWLECPLCDMWRRYKFSLLSRNMIVSGCNYGVIPAFDFEMDTDKFRKEVDDMNDFTVDEIREMQKYNIHNIDKYDTK